MNRPIHVLQAKHQQTGYVLVSVIIIAIIVVLVLMWQAGLFSGADTGASSQTTSEATRSATADKAPSVDEQTSPPTSATAPSAPQQTQLEPLVETPTGKDDASIRALAESLVAAHPIDLATCSAETDANKALECAAAAQSTALSAVFEDYNARRADGDLVANARGGEVLKLVVTELQKRIEPFADAAN